MGRCNNRRAQEAAAAARNVPSRARFSKGPPNKRKGRGGGRGRGRDNGGGRGGGRGQDEVKKSVINKISERVKNKQRDAGGISGVISSSSRNNISSMKTRKRHPLDGINIMKLDEITLSEESLSLLSQILMDLGLSWEIQILNRRKSIKIT
mmetsp:Transcript_31890/g.46733  ORF Transcript_31890/g.46733 Transcript_31890/m.46733 type:complete len:151 (-) Transcript_31890:145-597(-)